VPPFLPSSRFSFDKIQIFDLSFPLNSQTLLINPGSSHPVFPLCFPGYLRHQQEPRYLRPHSGEESPPLAYFPLLTDFPYSTETSLWRFLQGPLFAKGHIRSCSFRSFRSRGPGFEKTPCPLVFFPDTPIAFSLTSIQVFSPHLPPFSPLFSSPRNQSSPHLRFRDGLLSVTTTVCLCRTGLTTCWDPRPGDP